VEVTGHYTDRMSALGGGDRSRSSWTRPATRLIHVDPEERRSRRAGLLGAGTLACPRCDAPVLIDAVPHSPGHALACPFCDHGAPLREFLSLSTPGRPARVVVQVQVTRERA
jgi:hypothetical protein